MTFSHEGNIGPVVWFSRIKKVAWFAKLDWNRNRFIQKISWIMAWRKSLKMCFRSQTSQRPWNLDLWVMKSANLSESGRSAHPRAPATQHQSLWPFVWLTKKQVKIKTQSFFGDFPIMTKWGTFIINGERTVIVSQLVRSPGVTSMIRWTGNGKVGYRSAII